MPASQAFLAKRTSIIRTGDIAMWGRSPQTPKSSSVAGGEIQAFASANRAGGVRCHGSALGGGLVFRLHFVLCLSLRGFVSHARIVSRVRFMGAK